MAVAGTSQLRPALRIAIPLAVAGLCLILSASAASAVVTSYANIPFSGISPGGVDMATGEIIIVCRPDLFLDGPFPVEFSRYYASMLAREGLATSHLGPNWLGTYDCALSITGTNATVVTNRGAAIHFTQGVGGGWNLTSPTYAQFKFDVAGGMWRFTNPVDQHIYFFDGTTRLLTQILDRNGNALNLTYSGTLLSQVSDGLGRSLQFQYDAGNLLIQVSDGSRIVHYAYTGGVLTGFVDANSHNWGYATQPGPIQALITGVLEPMGNTPMTNAYDPLGRVSSQTDALTHTVSYGYDQPSGNAYTDPLSNTWTYLHDSQNRLMTRTDPLGGPTSYSYDALGRVQMMSRPMGDPTNFGYDAGSGYINSLQLADGPSYGWTYSPHVIAGATLFDLTAASYPDGTNQSFGRDPAGNITNLQDQAGQHWLGTYNARGQILTWTNPAGGVTTFTYDPLGRPATVKDNANNVTHYSYDGSSRLIGVQWPDGNTQGYGYDNLNAMTGFTDERSKLWSRTFDLNERLINDTDPLLESTGYGYDAADRLTSVTDPLSHPEQIAYDPVGRLSSFTDRSGRVTTYQYDTLDRLTGISDPASGTDAFGYDQDSRMTSVQDPLGHGMTLGYNFRDLVTHITDPVSSGFDYGYDSMGRLHTATGPLGLNLIYNYDARGLLTSFTNGPAETDFPRTVLGEIDHVRDANGNNWPRTYDPQGRITSVADPLTRTTTYDYDSMSRPFHIGRPDGTVQQIGYDAGGRITGMVFGAGGPTLTYGYDDANRLTSTAGAAFGYDAAGRMTSSNGFSYSYDADGRMLSETLAPGKTISYAYNSRGLLSQVSDWMPGTTTFLYDAARRLTNVSRPDHTTATYQYDSADRLTSAVEINPGPQQISSIVITRDALGRPSSINRRQPSMPGATSPANASLTYDAASQFNGATHDVFGRTTSDGSRTFEWDAASRLHRYAALADSPSFTYDGLAQILSSSHPTGPTSSSTVAQAWGYGGTIPTVDDMEVDLPTHIRWHVHTPSGLLLHVLDSQTGERRFYHYDEAGNTAYLTSDTGSVTTAYTYTPYGNVRVQGQSGDPPFPWTWGAANGWMSLGSSGLWARGGSVYDDRTMRVVSGLTTGSGPVEKNPGPAQLPGGTAFFRSVSGLKMETDAQEFGEGGVTDYARKRNPVEGLWAAVEIVPPWPWKDPGPPGTPGAAVEIVPPWPWKAPGPPQTPGEPYLQYRFGTVFATKVRWSHDDEGPSEHITFDYGALMVGYMPQKPPGGGLRQPGPGGGPLNDPLAGPMNNSMVASGNGPMNDPMNEGPNSPMNNGLPGNGLPRHTPAHTPIDTFVWWDDLGPVPDYAPVHQKPKRKAFEISNWSFDIENPTTIGSATGGAGSGKAEFGEFTIKNPAQATRCLWCP